ncbi:MAG: hypothetical protein IH989_06895 [Planctomycetes bacterium]|nr:hypothetical protein [Planctomycetota bacterium]
MTTMTRIERMTAVLRGEQPDRTPVSYWYHFPPECHCGPPAVQAHLKHLERHQLDFLKIMNDNGYPTRREVRSADDLGDLPVLRGDEDAYASQLELIRSLASELKGKVLMITTLFNAWTLLRRVVTPRSSGTSRPPTLGGPVNPVDHRLSELLVEDRGSVGMALDAIAASQANFAAKCIEAGADGIFLSVRDDWVDTEENGPDVYDQLVRTGDGQILSAARGARFNMLHVCGVASNFDAFAAYPVHGINWADRAAGPAISEVVGKVKSAVCGGVDNLGTLVKGSPPQVEEEVHDALRQAGNHPMIVAPGCTFDPQLVPEENLDAMVKAVRAST